MVMIGNRFSLSLFGPFRLQNPQGGIVRISSKKAIALVAMLAMSPNGERTRGWIQDKLWGRRAANEAHGSLRRELSNLRAVLNRNGTELLLAQRDCVRLELSLVEVDALEILHDR
jgi:DNA-binding SARP family transcriptional activator